MFEKLMLLLAQGCAWIEAHPVLATAFIWPVLSASVTWAFKPRTEEEYANLAAISPRLAALTKLIAALGLDPVKVVKVVRQLVKGTAENRTAKRWVPPHLQGALLVMGAVVLGMTDAGCNPRQALTVLDMLAEKAKCAIANQDLPNDQIFERCAVQPEDIPRILSLLGEARSQSAKAAMDARADEVARHEAHDHTGPAAPKCDGGVP